jgi:hypothetical protein
LEGAWLSTAGDAYKSDCWNPSCLKCAVSSPIDEEVRRLIIGDEEPITCRPADLLELILDKIPEEVKLYLKAKRTCLPGYLRWLKTCLFQGFAQRS